MPFMFERIPRLPRLLSTLVTAMLLAAQAACSTPPAASSRASPTSAPASATSASTVTAVDPVSQDWQADMDRFAALDVAGPPPANPVVFTGSSSARMWTTLAEDFPGVPVLNRGFGGSQVRDALWHADQVAIRYRPRQVVLYAGDNDIDAGRSPQQVLADLQALVARLRQDLPSVRISYLAIKPSPLRIDQLERQREANALVRTWLSTQPDTDFIDVATPMLDARGQPREELFIGDRLHMSPAGYALWRRLVAPYLVR